LNLPCHRFGVSFNGAADGEKSPHTGKGTTTTTTAVVAVAVTVTAVVTSIFV
jgi:hypothetical protein